MPYPQTVGEVRPSLMLFSCGVGAAVDLPNLSVMVMGLDDWDLTYARDIVEERLLAAVRQKLGPQVQRLVSPPLDLEEGKRNMPNCKARHPHLRVYDESGCEQQMRGILLGASNSWFPVTLSAIFVPTARGRIEQLVEQHWGILDKAASIEVLAAFRAIGQLRSFANISDKDLWEAIEAKRAGSTKKQEEGGNLKDPEWEILSHADPAMNGPEFSVRPVPVPEPYEKHFSKVVLVERMREVRALVGFTRIESPGDYADIDQLPVGRRAPICRGNPTWIPASEVRGEGIFIQFQERAIVEWSKRPDVRQWERTFVQANQLWGEKRGFDPEQATFPGIRYVLIHSFAHALMRQMALECGYTAASIRERVYSKNPEAEGGPMAGVLLYTAAPDSEGTLGGLVSLGRTEELQRHVEQALQKMWLCTSDSLCAEHDPLREPVTLHAAACHACLFASETSCERGNRFLDRSVLVPTFDQKGQAFFDMEQDKS